MINDLLTQNLLQGITSPNKPLIYRYEDYVENYIELTDSEKSIRDANNKSGLIAKKLLTIYKIEDIPVSLTPNRESLTRMALKLEQESGMSMIYTSVFRSMEYHIRIYKAINAERALKGLELLAVPKSSKHLAFLALDCTPKDRPIADLHKLLTEDFLKFLGAWMEHPDHTKSWAHLQALWYPSWTPEKSRKFHI